MQFIIPALMLIHGALHLIGLTAFAVKGNKPEQQRKWPWVAACVILIAAAILQVLHSAYWWALAAPAIILSQLCIHTLWHKAKAGTLMNIIILAFATISFSQWHFYRGYRNDVIQAMQQKESTEIVTEKDISSLPEPVKKYMRYVGVIGRPAISNFCVSMTGKLRRNNTSDWMQFESKQYNFLSDPTRLFFLNATMNYLPVAGYHRYKENKATMDIRLLSLIPVQQQRGYKMNQSETVTYFNDICVFAPGALTDKRITWLNTYDNKVEALFTNNNISIRAWLYFNDSGQLVNFISGDRYATTDSNTLIQRSWSTPLSDYKINGLKLATTAQAIYEYGEGPFVYGTFSVTDIRYNCSFSD